MRLIHIITITLGIWLYASCVAGEPVKFDPSQAIFVKHPTYPLEARKQHVTGSGIFILDIDQNTSRVTSATIKKSTGDKMLDAACLKAMIDWRFKPHLVTKVWIPIEFRM